MPSSDHDEHRSEHVGIRTLGRNQGSSRRGHVLINPFSVIGRNQAFYFVLARGLGDYGGHEMSNNTQRDQQVSITKPSKHEKRQKQFKRFLKALSWLYRLWYWFNFLLGLLDGGDS